MPAVTAAVAAIASRQPSWMMRVWVDSALAGLGLTYNSAAQKAAWREANRIADAQMFAGQR